MNFPNVKVQPHWLATLQRAAAVMPNCRWVCAAVDNGVEPDTEKEICEAISEAIQPWIIVNTWYFHETDTQLLNSKDYRIEWIDRMIEQCRSTQKSD
jgi:hypothetical protein